MSEFNAPPCAKTDQINTVYEIQLLSCYCLCCCGFIERNDVSHCMSVAF